LPLWSRRRERRREATWRFGAEHVSSVSPYQLVVRTGR